MWHSLGQTNATQSGKYKRVNYRIQKGLLFFSATFLCLLHKVITVANQETQTNKRANHKGTVNECS